MTTTSQNIGDVIVESRMLREFGPAEVKDSVDFSRARRVLILERLKS
jgi:hypothetical protein